MNQRTKGMLSRGVGVFRETSKRACSFLAAKILGRYSYPLVGVPSGLAHSLNPAEGLCKILYADKLLEMRVPKTVDPDLYWRFRAMLSGGELPESGVLVLKEGIATSTGGNLSSKAKLAVTFLQAIDGKKPHEHDLFRFSTRRFFPKIYHADQPVVTLAAGWQGAFYHWVFEVLPRLHLAEKGGYPLDSIYVESSSAFQKESLELIGLNPDQIINVKEYNAVHAPQLIIPSIPETPTVWSCQFLRSRILPQLEKRSPLRLYVSRSDAGRRRIINEEEVFPLLKSYGFEKVVLSDLSFSEQAEIFSSAEAVVGPHGAGFSHLVFCKPTTPVLEIFSPAYVNPCYWHVCDRVDLPYYYLFGEGKRYPDFFDPHLDPDIVVDKEKLRASLRLMGIS